VGRGAPTGDSLRSRCAPATRSDRQPFCPGPLLTNLHGMGTALARRSNEILSNTLVRTHIMPFTLMTLHRRVAGFSLGYCGDCAFMKNTWLPEHMARSWTVFSRRIWSQGLAPQMDAKTRLYCRISNTWL